MNVTFLSRSSQVPVLRRAWATILRTVAAGLGGFLLATGALHAETLTNLEAVDVNGVSTNTPKRSPETNNVILLPGIVVTGTPIIKGNGLTPLAGEVTTVSQEQIQELNAQDLQSALRETPGVVATHYDPIGSFGGGQGGAVFIRGMGVSRPGAEIQLDIDGIPNYNSVWTHPLLDMLSVDIAQRIDVYKGAQPVLYGNMAFGVVDMNTKRQTDPGFTTSLELAGGSYDTLVEVAETGGKVDNFDYYLVESYRSSDGDRPHSDGELQNYFGRIGYALNTNWEAHVVFNRTENWADDPGAVNSGFNDGRFNDDDYLIIVTLANHYENADGYVKGYWNRGTLNWVNQYDGTANDETTLTKYDNYGVKTREAFYPWDGGTLMAGVDGDFISGKFITTDPDVPMNGEILPRTTFQIIQPYGMFSQRWDFDKDVSLQPSAGVRYFDHNVFPGEYAPQAGLVLGVKETEFHASYARGVNYPGIFVEAIPALNEPSYHSLHAETLDHYELGASRRFGKLAKLDLTLFYDGGQNRIVFDVTAPYPFPWENIGRFHTEGLETALTVTPIRDLSLFGGFTVLEADPSDLPYTPQWTASAGATYRFLKHFRLSVDSQYVSSLNAVTLGPNPLNEALATSSTIGAYFLVNAKLSYGFALPCWHLHGEIFAAGQNLTDANYQEQPGYPMPGINGMGGIRVSF
jgi:iron complex outermembrane receptor protein